MAGLKNKGYLKDVEQRADGSFEYTGDVFGIKDNGTGTGTSLRGLVILAVLLIILIILSGCIDAAGANNAFYVIIPYVGEVCSLFVLCRSLAKLIGEKGRVRAFIYEPIKERIPVACKILTAFALVGMAMSILYLVRTGFEDKVFKSIAYLAIKLITAAVAVIFDKAFGKIEWVKIN